MCKDGSVLVDDPVTACTGSECAVGDKSGGVAVGDKSDMVRKTNSPALYAADGDFPNWGHAIERAG